MRLALPFAFLVTLAAPAAAQVEWEPGLEQARARSRSTWKPILIYVFDSG